MAVKLWLDYFLKQDCAAWPKFKDTLNTSNRFVNNNLVTDIVNPTITSAGALLTCTTSAASYQWYLNNNPILSATSNTYNATANGNYYCEVKYVYTNCPYNSNVVNINTTGIQALTTLKSFVVYPNPTLGNIEVSYTPESNNPVTFEVYDIAGRLAYKLTEESTAGIKLTKELNIETLERGTYILYVRQQNFKGAYKIIKQ